MNSILVKTHQLVGNLTGKKNFLDFVRNTSFKVVDDKDFSEKVEQSKGPVVVDFFATWCGPCRTQEPRLDSVVAKHNGKITLAKVDIDDMGELAAKYEVGTIPALVVFRNGKVEDRLVGLQDEEKLKLWMEKLVNSKTPNNTSIKQMERMNAAE